MKHLRSGLLGVVSSAALLVFCVGEDPSVVANGPGTASGSDAGSSRGPIGEGGDVETDGSGGDAGASPFLQNAVSVTAGAGHTCALLQDGAVVCWGDNANGQLGVRGIASSSVPRRVALGPKARAITAGAKHTCAVTEVGRVLCWGDDTSAQTGGPTDAGPREVAYADGGAIERMVEVSAGTRHTCAREQPTGSGPFPSVGPAVCWGDNHSYALGQLSPYGPNYGRATAEPGLDPGGDDTALGPFAAEALALGSDFGCAIVAFLRPPTAALTVAPACWGVNGGGQLGRIGANEYARPQILTTDAGALATRGLLAAGRAHACLRTATSPPSLFCWGSNLAGQISDATDGSNVRVASRVNAIDPARITALAAGGDATCAITDEGVRCVGESDSGQRGDGTVSKLAEPTWSTVANTDRASAIAVSGTHVCAVLGGGERAPGPVVCWGRNTVGQLGDGLDLAAGYPEADRRYLRAAPVPVRAALD